MSPRVDGAERVYEAATIWVERGLQSDDSLFTPGQPIWSRRWLRELRERFLDRPDDSNDSFVQRLSRQLADSPSEVYQLMGEALYFYFLIVSTQDSSGEEGVINEVLDSSPTPVAIPRNLVGSLTPGICNPGQLYHQGRAYQVGFLIEFVEQWKEQSAGERERLLNDPWAFKDFAAHLNLRSALLRDHPRSSDPQREALLHLVFPDTFEPIVSVPHKRRITETFAHFVADPTEDVDRKLEQIRGGLEAEERRNIHFYEDDIRSQWESSPPAKTNPWDEFVRRAQELVDSGALDEQEGYKLEIIETLRRARDAVLSGDRQWPELVRQGLANNLTVWRPLPVLRQWFDSQPDDALDALQALWADDGTPPGERVRAFLARVPEHLNYRGVGTRLTPVSVLLMALGTDYPPFRWTPFYEAYDYTGCPRPPEDADEGVMYEHALGFLDQLIERSAGRPDNRLDAQGIVWLMQWVTGGKRESAAQPDVNGEDGGEEPEEDDPTPPEPPSLEELADELMLAPAFLRDVEKLLGDKRQIIFQGPPGTGKTFVARKLAACLAGSPERVRLVQFHPSYAYEDFVQGFRPALRNGQPGFELRPGPLLDMAERARREPGANYFLVIDEINRGNLAKVFGELYFLLEYRDEPMQLQYSESEFSLPDNFYIIGTMNTADRSIALVDLALRRRFHFVEFHPGEWPVQGLLQRWLDRNVPGMEWVADVVDSANEKLGGDSEAAIGPSYFMRPGLDDEQVGLIWEHNVRPYVQEQLYGQPDRLAEFKLDTLRREAGGSAEAADTGGRQDEEADGGDAAD